MEAMNGPGVFQYASTVLIVDKVSEEESEQKGATSLEK